jgi:hypothetical protein
MVNSVLIPHGVTISAYPAAKVSAVRDRSGRHAHPDLSNSFGYKRILASCRSPRSWVVRYQCGLLGAVTTSFRVLAMLGLLIQINRILVEPQALDCWGRRFLLLEQRQEQGTCETVRAGAYYVGGQYSAELKRGYSSGSPRSSLLLRPHP